MHATSDLETFRKQTRGWLEANCPAAMRQPLTTEDDLCWGGRNWTFASEAQRQWLERMAAHGWTVPTWPRDYGGGGLSADEATVLAQDACAWLPAAAGEFRHLDARAGTAQVRH